MTVLYGKLNEFKLNLQAIWMFAKGFFEMEVGGGTNHIVGDKRSCQSQWQNRFCTSLPYQWPSF